MSGLAKVSLRVEEKYGVVAGWLFFFGVIIGSLFLGGAAAYVVEKYFIER